MKKAVIFLTDGFEETEAVFPYDILHRTGVDVSFVSITGKLEVTGSHGIKVIADGLISGDIDADMFVLPGGPGASKYIDNKFLIDILHRQNDSGGYIAAICAAPVTLGKLGFLKDKAATCYPDMIGELIAKERRSDAAVTDGNIITGCSPGASAQFGFALACILAGEDAAERVKEAMYF